jgi:hypothetical protein
MKIAGIRIIINTFDNSKITQHTLIGNGIQRNMVDTTSILALIGASSGSFSVLVNAVTARRASLEAQRPKLNVDLTSDVINDKIVCHLEMQNVGTKPMNIKSMRLYIFDNGFEDDFMLGLANYSTNLFIYRDRILNKVRDIDIEFTYDNLVNLTMEMFGYDRDYVTSVLTPENYDAVKAYSDGLKSINVGIEGYEPVVFIRPFFLFPKSISG